MSNKRERRGNVDAFGDRTRNAPTNNELVTAIGYGDLDRLNFNEKRISVRSVDIFTIYPDTAQPRRVIPSAIRKHWNGEPQTVGEMFALWLDAVRAERGEPLALNTLLMRGTTDRGEEDDYAYQYGPFEASLMKIIELAASIYKDGLLNPISVVRYGEDRHTLETGERRWLAYHLLYHYAPDESNRRNWGKIPAQFVEAVDVWRQAAENSMRADLNAVGKARQYAILLMALEREINGSTFASYHELVQPGGCDRPYYAQAADLRVPYGSGERLLNAMGMEHRTAFYRAKKILQLPDEVWTIADDANVPEDVLLTLSDLPVTEALQQIRNFVEGVSDGSAQQAKAKAAREASVQYTPGTPQHFTRTMKLVLKARPDKPERGYEALEKLQELREWIDQQERRIQEMLNG